MDASSDHVQFIPLSGRTLIASIPFAPTDARRAALADGAMADDGRQPMPGDLRLSATIDPEHRARPGSAAACVGTLAASIFDGICWQRFELTSLTTMCKFVSVDQLRAILGWTTHAARDAAGRGCRRSTSASGLPIYELSPLAAPVVVPKGSAAQLKSSRS